MALGIKPTVDFAFKMIFGSPENASALIGLLNAILDLASPIEQIEIMNPFSYKEFSDDKQIVLDVRARDSGGRFFNIEMQVSLPGDLKERLTYYVCKLYVEQLSSGKNYEILQPAISICLLSRVLFDDTKSPHHHFRLHDVENVKTLDDLIELHTVELVKYDLEAATIHQASKLKQWVFFFLYADQYTAEELRVLLPGVEFDQAIGVIERISQKTEDRTMYDQREKAQRDYQWGLDAARKEGEARGVLMGSIATLQGIIGDPVSSVEELKAMDLDTLNRLCAELQDRLRSRGN